MKNRVRRFLSVFLAAAMLTGQGNMTAFAEGTTEAAAVETAAEKEVAAAAEEAPATEAPTEKPTEPPTEPPTEAPTEAPTEKVTEAPAQDTPSSVPAETEAPGTETPAETPAPEETSTEASTETVTEKATEQITEKETESKKTDFTWSGNGLTVKVTLSKKDALPGSAQMMVTPLTKKSDAEGWKAAKKLVEKEVSQGHRELSEALFYEIALTVDGQQAEISENAEVTFTYDKAQGLGLSKYAQAEAKAFALTDKSAKELTEITLSDSLKIKTVKVAVKDCLLIGFAGIQNRENDGTAITKSGLENALGDALDYAVLAREYSGSMTEDVLAENLPATAGETGEENAEDGAKASEVLASLAEYSLVLANGKSSDSVQVINLYTDEDGKLNTEPMEEVLSGGSIDVSDTTLVINLVAGDKKQRLSIPVYDVEYQNSPAGGETASYAGRVVYNLVAEEKGEFVSYLGAAELEGTAAGTYLAPKASLESSAKLLGAVYADKVTVSTVQKAVVGMDGQKETEAATEAPTEAEAVTETATEAPTETEAATEAPTEAEAVTETATEAPTETEAATEAPTETEAVTETATEAPAETEAVTETATEAPTETATEAVTETETEQELVVEETEPETVTAEEEAVLDSLELGADERTVSVKPLPVTKITKTMEAVQGATLALLDAEGKVLSSWTTDAAGTAVDISSYLLPNGNYVLRETVTPDGYMKSNDISFSIEENGTAKDANGDVLSELKIVNYPIAESSDDPGQSAAALSLKLAVAEETETEELVYLDGAEFVIKDENGVPLKDGSGNQYTFSSEAKVMTLNLDPALYESLTKDLQNNGQKKFRIAQIKAKTGYQISGYSEAEITVQKDDQGKVSLQLPEKETKDNVVIFYNKKISTEAAGSISVTKRNYFGNTDHEIYSKAGGTFYAALFQDADKEIRISDVKTIQIKTGYKSATILFENLPNGTYYVGETDEYGNLVGEVTDSVLAKDPFYAEYIYSGGQKNVVIKVDKDAAFDADAEKVTIQNRYFEMPEGYLYTASFQITNQVKDESGAALASNSTFYAGIYTKSSQNEKYTYIGKKAIKMDGKSEMTISVELTMSTETKYVMVKEVDANGKEVVSGSVYNITVNPSEIVLKQGETKAQTVTITNTKVASSGGETETEPAADPNNLQAELKLTKKVVYKNTPIRVNSVYYIGIFDDAALTKLRYKKAMTFTNASELTATLKVNLYKLESKEVTFYFAEVDEQGNVLKGGKDFGYDISQNKNSVTLNANNLADEVIITNTVIEGEKVAQELANPTSGLAGDSAALATAQNLAASSNSSENTTTGDDNPILQLIIILIVSVVVIIAIVVVMIIRRNRSKRNRGNRRKRD